MANRDSRRRIARVILYSLGATGIAVLTWMGWFYEAPPGFDEQASRVFALVRESRYEDAMTALRDLEEEFPGHIKIPLMEAYVHEVEGEFKKARAAYEVAVKRVPEADQRRVILLSIADLHRREGDVDRAEKMLAEVAKEYGESDRTRRLRAVLYSVRGCHDHALSEVDRLVEEHPGDPHALRLRKHLRRLAEASASTPETQQK